MSLCYTEILHLDFILSDEEIEKIKNGETVQQALTMPIEKQWQKIEVHLHKSMPFRINKIRGKL